MEEPEVEVHSLWEPARPAVGSSSEDGSFLGETAAACLHPLSLLVLAAAVYGFVQVSRQGSMPAPKDTPGWRSLSARGDDLRDAPAALKEDSLSQFRDANTVEYGGPRHVARGPELEAAVADALKAAKKETR